MFLPNRVKEMVSCRISRCYSNHNGAIISNDMASGFYLGEIHFEFGPVYRLS
jgi:hypothetical protein